MRGTVTALRSPHPVGDLLPGVYAEDDLLQRFVSAFDEVLAPVFGVLDCFDAYLDPALAPADFVDWLAHWVALSSELEPALADEWSPDRRRTLVARAVDLHRWRGTRRGLVMLLEAVTGGQVEVVDSGGCTASPVSGGALPGAERPGLTVRVRVADPSTVDLVRLEALVALNKPAHLPHTLEVVT
jgi:phage tail-like protein